MRPLLVLPLLVLVPLAAAAYTISDERASIGAAQSEWLWPLYPYAEGICVTFSNDSSQRLYLPNDPPWWVEDATGQRAFGPGTLDWNVPIAPGETYTDCFDDDEALVILPGEYTMVWPYWEDQFAAHHALRMPFTLSATAPPPV